MLKHLKKNLGMALLLCLLSTLALAFGGRDGVWKGSIQRGNAKADVLAQFLGSGAEIHFSGAFTCKVKARYEKADGRALIYRFSEAEINAQALGHVCYDLLDHSLEVTHADGDGTMRIDFTVPDNKWKGKWTGELEREPDHQ